MPAVSRAQGAIEQGALKRTKLAKVRGWLVADPLAEKLLRRAIERTSCGSP